MNILFLCNKSPWPTKEGGPMAMNMLIEGLIGEGHHVKVLAVNSFKFNVSPTDIPESYKQATGIELIDLDLRVKPLNAFLNLFTGKSYHVTRFISADFRDRLTLTLTTGDFEIVQLETLFMCPYIDSIRACSKAKIVLRTHNIEHLIWERIARETSNPLKKWYLRHLARTLKNYENKVIHQVDGIAAITATDAAYFGGVTPPLTPPQRREGSFVPPNIPILTLPFGINPARYHHQNSTVEPLSLFSIGSMNWLPNQEGIRWFLQDVWPGIHSEFPELRYYLAGREMPAWMTSLQIPNVVVLGEVADAREFIDSKSIMIVPLFSGSGIRVKIIEGMAAGKTIISTTIGAEGISYTDRENILIADMPCDFFEMISFCIGNPAKCLQIGAAARKLVETSYNQKILVKKLTAFYQQILS